MPDEDLLIPHDIIDIASLGLAKVEIYGANARLYWFTERPRPGEDPRREAVVSLWVPVEALVSMGAMIASAMGRPPMSDATQKRKVVMSYNSH